MFPDVLNTSDTTFVTVQFSTFSNFTGFAFCVHFGFQPPSSRIYLFYIYTPNSNPPEILYNFCLLKQETPHPCLFSPPDFPCSLLVAPSHMII
jgi:hypothetical protein